MTGTIQHLNLRYELAAFSEVLCPYCGRAPGKPCITRRGKEVPPLRTHAARWQARRKAYRRPRRYVLKVNDLRFGLSAGDVLVCQPYWLDGAKVTVLYRASDGFDPECNQYRAHLEPVVGPDGVVR